MKSTRERWNAQKGKGKGLECGELREKGTTRRMEKSEWILFTEYITQNIQYITQWVKNIHSLFSSEGINIIHFFLFFFPLTQSSIQQKYEPAFL